MDGFRITFQRGSVNLAAVKNMAALGLRFWLKERIASRNFGEATAFARSADSTALILRNLPKEGKRPYSRDPLVSIDRAEPCLI